MPVYIDGKEVKETLLERLNEGQEKLRSSVDKQTRLSYWVLAVAALGAIAGVAGVLVALLS